MCIKFSLIITWWDWELGVWIIWPRGFEISVRVIATFYVLGVCPMSIVSCLSWPNTNLYFLLPTKTEYSQISINHSLSTKKLIIPNHFLFFIQNSQSFFRTQWTFPPSPPFLGSHVLLILFYTINFLLITGKLVSITSMLLLCFLSF